MGTKIDIKTSSNVTSRSTAKLMKTGQTISYLTGDDGDIEAGRNTDFTTLAENNVFGNTNRFTDELGGATYTNNIVIDWSTYDGATVLGWYRVNNGLDISWTLAMAGALATSIGTFTTGWKLPNIQELFSLTNYFLTNIMSYSPLNLPALANAYWTGTNTSVIALRIFNTFGTVCNSTSKGTTSGMRYIPCRVFTVTGTTLT